MISGRHLWSRIIYRDQSGFHLSLRLYILCDSTQLRSRCP